MSIASNGIAPLRLNLFPFAPINRYICAMYFSMTSLATVGFGDIVPRNHAERIYCMVRCNAAGRAEPRRAAAFDVPQPTATSRLCAVLFPRCAPPSSSCTRHASRARMHTGGVQDARGCGCGCVRRRWCVPTDSARLDLGHTQIMMAFGGACYGFVIGTVTSLVTQVSRPGTVSQTAWCPARARYPAGGAATAGVSGRSTRTSARTTRRWRRCSRT